MDVSTSDETLSLSQHVKALYPLARVMTAPERARSLVQSVYERAASVPPDRRPENERGWLFHLMIAAYDGTLHPAGAQIHPKGETSFTNDPFREQVAERLAHRMLPVAFASCSIHERFILSIDVLGNPSDEALAVALDTSATNARSIRDRARSSLRAALHDVLHESEQMLVDVALPDDVLLDQLQTLLIDRFENAPDALYERVTEILVTQQAERSPEAPPSTSSRWDRIRAFVPDSVSPTGIVGTIFIVIVLAIGVQNMSSLRSSQSAQPIPVAEFTVDRVNEVQDRHPVTTPENAASFIQSTWNRQVTPPTIENARLQAVGRVPVSNGTGVPVLLYENDDGSPPLLVFAFNYAFFDENSEEIALATNARAKLATDTALLVEATGDHAVGLWRQRDEIYVAVAQETSAEALHARIRPDGNESGR